MSCSHAWQVVLAVVRILPGSVDSSHPHGYFVWFWLLLAWCCESCSNKQVARTKKCNSPSKGLDSEVSAVTAVAFCWSEQRLVQSQGQLELLKREALCSLLIGKGRITGPHLWRLVTTEVSCWHNVISFLVICLFFLVALKFIFLSLMYHIFILKFLGIDLFLFICFRM